MAFRIWYQLFPSGSSSRELLWKEIDLGKALVCIEQGTVEVDQEVIKLAVLEEV